jgi:hypothetical protein
MKGEMGGKVAHLRGREIHTKFWSGKPERKRPLGIHID